MPKEVNYPFNQKSVGVFLPIPPIQSNIMHSYFLLRSNDFKNYFWKVYHTYSDIPYHVRANTSFFEHDNSFRKMDVYAFNKYYNHYEMQYKALSVSN